MQFVDDIALLGGCVEGLPQFAERQEETVAGYGMEISSDKSKILTNNIKPRRSTNIWMNGKVLEEVDQFK